MRYFKSLITTVLLMVALVSCDTLTGDPDLPIPLDETLDNTGAFVRMLSVPSPVFDGANTDTAKFVFVGEVSDEENGALAESIAFYAKYVDYQQNELDEIGPLVTYQVGNLQTSEQTGLPRGTFTVTLSEILDSYGNQLNADDLNGGDRFDIRWVLTMKDGTTYTNTDVSPAVTGGFYTSPFFQRVNVVIGVPPNLFVGEYTFEQLDPAPAVAWASACCVPGNPNSEGWIFDSQSSPGSFTATLSVNPNNELQGRVFEATYLEEWGYSPSEIPIEVGLFNPTTPLYLTLGGEVDNGLGCSLGLALGPANGEGTFDPADDSEFTLVLTDNVRGDCGQPTTQVRFTATKN